MSNGYIASKAAGTAGAIVKDHAIDFSIALNISTTIWEEARRCILKVVGSYGAERWYELPAGDKAAVCSTVLKGLLDREKLVSFLSGRTKSIV